MDDLILGRALLGCTGLDLYTLLQERCKEWTEIYSECMRTWLGNQQPLQLALRVFSHKNRVVFLKRIMTSISCLEVLFHATDSSKNLHAIL